MMWLEVLAGTGLFIMIVGLTYVVLATLLARSDDQ